MVGKCLTFLNAHDASNLLCSQSTINELEIKYEYLFDEDEGIDKDSKTYNQNPANWQMRGNLKFTALVSNR